MPDSTPSPPASADYHRKRVARACEGCRLRKSKCDGQTPCCKCRANNIVCTVWKSKRPKDKVYPKGYVEVLEGQRQQLIAGLQEAYRRLLAADAWPGKKLSEGSGQPLVHDILLSLNVLQTSREGIKSDSMEEGSISDTAFNAIPTNIDSPISPVDSMLENVNKRTSDTLTRASISESPRKASARSHSGSPQAQQQQQNVSPQRSTTVQHKLFPKEPTQDQSVTSNLSSSPPQFGLQLQPKINTAQVMFPDVQSLPSKPLDTSNYIPPALNYSIYGGDPDISYPQLDAGCSCLPQNDVQMLDQTQFSMPDVSGTSWWMSDLNSDLKVPDVMSPSTDSLSDMLYREICSNHFMEMYDHDFDCMSGEHGSSEMEVQA